MTSYSEERKEAVLNKMLPPHNMTVPQISKEEGIPLQTLYSWRSKVKEAGKVVTGKPIAENWSAEAKLAVVIETATMTESQLNKYCREKGLFKEQIKQWKQDCLNGFQSTETQKKEAKKQAKQDKAEIKSLKADLRIKDKALAETTALLVLRKKLNALWEEESEES